MAQAFLGLRVSLTLNTGLSLEGKVSHIDSDSQLLTLNDGKLDQYQLRAMAYISIASKSRYSV
jgi:hypothetical protein